ncbi:hypothetical protein L226DRAFT_222551 [Lentinus tigrinus ALCF2SS1-7]|uniref:uncharacterized protein n=1 Tax=Lentinus tigrinus ALCF2SS1-7 TaxID=1328758 RepID=UPI0011661F98|nr:hypothetical protein L226DRAFT_222551 [Lentinus tigrinus ALCF2SS1-7]
MAPQYYSLCSTYESIAVAVTALSNASILVVDCEARDIARTTGVLSIVSISDVDARSVFLIDALALQDPSHPAFKPLFDLLENQAVMKLMWDGRADAIELRETYGVELRGVLDLQLVEVVSRPSVRGETDAVRRQRLSRGYFREMQMDISRNPAEFEGIHQVCGIDTCLKARGINNRKDGEPQRPECIQYYLN